MNCPIGTTEKQNVVSESSLQQGGMDQGLYEALMVGIEEAKRGEFVNESFDEIIAAAEREECVIF